MADINEIVSKKAIQGIIDLNKAITSSDDSLMKLLTTIEQGNVKLKQSGVSFKDLNNAQKQQAQNAQQLTAEEKKLQQIQKQNKLITEEVVRAKIQNSQKTKDLTNRIKESIAAERRETGSIDSLRAANKKLTQVRNATSAATEKGRKQIDLINKKIDQNNAKIKQNVSSLEQQKIGIGGYSQGITSALSQLGLMPPAVTQASGAIGGLTKGFKGLRLAIMSTGIGALVIALVSLVSYFQSTEEGAAKLQKILSPFKILFGNLSDAAADLGEGIINVFENPKQAIIDLWNGIKQNFINRIKATTKFIGAFGDVLQGIWELDKTKINQGLKDAGNAYVDMITGVENTTTKVQDALTGIIQETREENEKNIKVIERQLQLDKDRRAFKIEEAQLLADIAKQRLIANDDEKDALVQQEAINKAIELNEKLATKRKNLEQENLELLKLRASFSKSDAAVLDEIADKEAEIITLKKTQDDLERSLLRRKTTINNKVDAQIKKEKELIKLRAEAATSVEFEMEDEEEVPDFTSTEEFKQIQERTAFIVSEAKKAADQSLSQEEIKRQELKAAYEAGLIDYKAYQAALNNIAKEGSEKRLELAKLAIEASAMIGDFLIEDNQRRLDVQAEQNRMQRDHELAMAGDNQERIAEINRKFNRKEAELKTKQAKADKDAAIFKTIINIATAVATMLTAGPIAGQILAGIAAAIGAVQLATIASTPIPKFAKGTEKTPKGQWIAGEAGRELIKTRSGQFVMANQPTMFSGLEGAKVYTNKETETIMNRAGYDSPDLMQSVINSNNRVARAIERQPVLQFETSKRRIIERKGNYSRQYLNRKLYGV